MKIYTLLPLFERRKMLNLSKDDQLVPDESVITTGRWFLQNYRLQQAEDEEVKGVKSVEEPF